MKKIFLTIVLSFLLIVKALADEGMWLPLLLGQQVYNDMVKRGLKLTPEQLYSINKASIKDAIIIFGNGCTGEIVSNEGLIFTNHHCGYDAIASASSVEKNYLRDGFYALSKDMEISAKGITVQFLLRIEDVTKEIEDSAAGKTGADRLVVVNRVIALINERLSDKTKSIEARVSSLFKGNQFLVFIYQRYKDVRLVGTPAESIGKFGGDTDNWEWPRHTGDFSVFRVYSAADGSPADYDPKNIPLKPKYFLPVSIKPLKDGDYTMIYGYPGSTNRYETSLGVKLSIDINNPTLVNLRDMRLKYMFEEMKKDPAVKLKLASNYASVANYWKFYDGETKQLLKYDVYGQKKAQEDNFITWAKGKAEFENLFTEWDKVYSEWIPYAKHRVYINEGINGSALGKFAGSLMDLEKELLSSSGLSEKAKKALESADKNRKAFLEAIDKTSDQKILATVAQMFYNEIEKNQHPINFYETIKANYGDLKDAATYQKWAIYVFSNTMFFNDAKWLSFIQNPSAEVLQKDPAYNFAASFLQNWNIKYKKHYDNFSAKNGELGRLYIKGIMQMEPKKVRYPDATFTMRVSYGNVKSYVPRDAVKYDYVCTMNGVLQKYKPGDYEFDLPANFLELAKKKDYGQYMDPVKKDLVVTFITTNDITGGNSGSPVLNANGELIGLAFDGNYEALSHKMAFDKDLNRTICVDVRYVLWCIDKVGGASNLIKELKLMK